LVLAGPELANWRVPYAGSFYFDAEHPVERLAQAAAAVWAKVQTPTGNTKLPARALLKSAATLRTLTEQLRSALESGKLFSSDSYQRFLDEYDLSVDGLSAWPTEFEGLLSDVQYAGAWRGNLTGGNQEDLQGYIEGRLSAWENTNLYKFLRLS
jgi:phage major head subunit gpT-like protein